MAWYNATLEVKGGAPGKAKGTRLSELAKNDHEPDYPENPFPELISILMDVGAFIPGPMGDGPLTSVEIMAWQQGTGNSLTSWEFQTLRAMSSAYLVELQQAADPDRPPPWLQTPDANKRRRIAQHVRGVLHG